jgi:GNAT superfamily N-acetyltransferase
VAIPPFVPYARAHRDACLALFDEHCPEFFAANERDEYAAFLDACPDGYFVALENGDVIAAFGLIDAGATARRRINWILVARQTQGRGMGGEMMRDARRRAAAAGARVIDIAASHKSAPFFAKFGARAVRHIPDGWGPGMHRVDMEWRIAETLLTCAGGTLVLPQLVLVDRRDGGHLIVNPPREVWERSELSRDELIQWSCLVAAAGRAMIDVLPQLAGGCINYWEAGNWALHDMADPGGRKDPRVHRRVHLHLLGRSPHATDPSWQWGEAPRFPPFEQRLQWAASLTPLTVDECDAVVTRTRQRLKAHYDS